MACPGDKLYNCGGRLRNAVYDTGLKGQLGFNKSTMRDLGFVF